MKRGDLLRIATKVVEDDKATSKLIDKEPLMAYVFETFVNKLENELFKEEEAYETEEPIHD